MNTHDAHAQYLVRLCAAAIHGTEIPAPDFAGYDEAFLLKLISAHHLSGQLYPLLKNREGIFSDEAKQSLAREFRTAQLRDATQEDALEELAAAFAEKGIRFMVLKGIVQKRFYDKSYHRMMGDLDLLIFSQDRAAAREVMEGLGYETQIYDELYDDVYYRRPFLNVEVHVALGEEAEFSTEHYLTLWDRAVQSTVGENVFEMSPEDYYIYFIDHAAKHCRGHGTGIRTLIDLWYLKQRLLPSLDRALLDRVLARFDNLTFERELLKLCSVWFDGAEGDLFQTEGMRRYFVLGAGLYGNYSNAAFRHVIAGDGVEHAHARKRNLFLKNVFPPLSRMKARFPILEKMPWLLPVFWFWRALKAVFAPQKIKGEIKHYAAVSSGMDLQSEMRSRFGFLASSGSEKGTE